MKQILFISILVFSTGAWAETEDMPDPSLAATEATANAPCANCLDSNFGHLKSAEASKREIDGLLAVSKDSVDRSKGGGKAVKEE